MELTELRAELDRIDRDVVDLLEKRMEIAREIARYKIAHGLPVLDASREDQVLNSRQAMLTQERFAEDIRVIFTDIMAMSRREQEQVLRTSGEAGAHD